MTITDPTIHTKILRRDFLSATAGGMIVAGTPWLSRTAVAKGNTQAAAKAGPIAKVRIYPPIGVCRLGSSSAWFHAPEIPGLALSPEGGDFKDADGRIKKQVQRFRLYAFDRDDNIICELTSDNANSVWNVHLANTKAAWYGDRDSMEYDEDAEPFSSYKRNREIVSDRERESKLIIDGGSLSISGRNINDGGNDSRFAFEGKFWETETVRLGHLRTDRVGRLLVVPPNGLSRSPTARLITSITDNDGWYDDWSDGPVSAVVTVGSRRFVAESAWVVSVGPDFAPEIPPITTLYDVICDLNVRQGWSKAPRRPLSYMTYLYPLFRRISLTQWIAGSGRKTTEWLDKSVDFSSAKFMDRLADSSLGNADFRKHVFSLFRNPGDARPDPAMQLQAKLPYQLGNESDNYGSAAQWFQFPAQQFEFLESWASGEFFDDRNNFHDEPLAVLEHYPLAQQPMLITEAALSTLSGGAFQPGVELPIHLGAAPLYQRYYSPEADLFRIANGTRSSLSQDLGEKLTLTTLLKGQNATPPALGPQMAGDLTRWLGVPWQCEAFSCQQVQLRDDFPTAAWWPAHYPSEVLTEEDYALVMDPHIKLKYRTDALGRRHSWLRDVPAAGYQAESEVNDILPRLISRWENLGFVVRKPAPRYPAALSDLTTEIFVEVQHADRQTWEGNTTAKGRKLPS